MHKDMVLPFIYKLDLSVILKPRSTRCMSSEQILYLRNEMTSGDTLNRN